MVSCVKIVATCSGDCMVRVFSLGANECIATLSGHPSAVLKVCGRSSFFFLITSFISVVNFRL